MPSPQPGSSPQISRNDAVPSRKGRAPARPPLSGRGSDRQIERNAHHKAQFPPGTPDLRHIHGRGSPCWHAQHLDFIVRPQHRPHLLRQGADRERFCRSHIVGPPRLAALKNCKEPLHKIIGIEVAAMRRAVAVDDDGGVPSQERRERRFPDVRPCLGKAALLPLPRCGFRSNQL